MNKYKEIEGKTVEFFMQQVVKEQELRAIRDREQAQMMDKQLRNEHQARILSLIFALIAVLAIIGFTCFTCYCVYTGYPILGGFGGFFALAGIISAFKKES